MSKKPTWGSYADLMRAKREREARERSETEATETEAVDVEKPAVSVPPTMANSAMANSATMAKDTVPLWQTAIVADSATVAIPATVQPVSGYTRIPNTILDSLLSAIPPTEQSVYLRLYRLSLGFDRETCTVGYDRLAKSCHISRRTAQTAISRLSSLGLIESIQTGKSSDRATVYRVVVPGATDPTVAESATEADSATMAKSASNKERIKKTIKSARAHAHAREGVADAPPLDKFEIRKIVARLSELHHGDPDYTKDRLRSDVKTVLIGEGREIDERLLDEAIGK